MSKSFTFLAPSMTKIPLKNTNKSGSSMANWQELVSLASLTWGILIWSNYFRERGSLIFPVGYYETIWKGMREGFDLLLCVLFSLYIISFVLQLSEKKDRMGWDGKCVLCSVIIIGERDGVEWDPNPPPFVSILKKWNALPCRYWYWIKYVHYVSYRIKIQRITVRHEILFLADVSYSVKKNEGG